MSRNTRGVEKATSRAAVDEDIDSGVFGEFRQCYGEEAETDGSTADKSRGEDGVSTEAEICVAETGSTLGERTEALSIVVFKSRLRRSSLPPEPVERFPSRGQLLWLRT